MAAVERACYVRLGMYELCIHALSLPYIYAICINLHGIIADSAVVSFYSR